MYNLRLSVTTIVLASLTLSIVAPATSESHDACEREQEFLVTAYYSPLPDQTRYYLGSYESDIAFNGRGIAGNDGTNVYPGMIAAPSEVPFGSRIALPGMGIVGTVHDRGSAIQRIEDGTMRIDLWMGEGEEGLARALAWGAQRVKGKIYEPDHEAMPAESFDLAQFPAPESALARLPSNPIILLGIDDPQYGDTSSEVSATQHALKILGYFDHDITNYFGDVTRDALALFQRDLGIEGIGDSADERTRTALIAHRTIASEIEAPPLPEDDVLLRGEAGKEIRVLQRILSLLGNYEGKVDGEYSQKVMSSVYRFQTSHGIVQSLSDIGAGMVGPQTRRALLAAWREYRISKRGGSQLVASR